MTEVEFQAWPKTARLFRDIVITEKIDGTNAAIRVTEDMKVFAQSRKRMITPEADNYGFARWVYENADHLANVLGPGLHFGEWWGQGIQRRYDMGTKAFSLFNTDRFSDLDDSVSVGGVPVGIVPVLYRGPFSESVITSHLRELSRGSYAAPFFENPEGICIYHTQTKSVFKVTLDNNDSGKWESS
ncbi:RNA ligase family protein [Streptomyces sp. NBC_01500]|uniref:RNA ligase family protein n=1 Tax=Streptomyces sp. NBC_01500 TaxID=2903886 RepID=UPI002254869C|nr:RNA ligase family protein [Streptomyces sp. NBC_01500]MCX4554113.1 RNA ligase family protein [Streptomyces sp. NBC_01500]